MYFDKIKVRSLHNIYDYSHLKSRYASWSMESSVLVAEYDFMQCGKRFSDWNRWQRFLLKLLSHTQVKKNKSSYQIDVESSI